MEVPSELPASVQTLAVALCSISWLATLCSQAPSALIQPEVLEVLVGYADQGENLLACQAIPPSDARSPVQEARPGCLGTYLVLCNAACRGARARLHVAERPEACQGGRCPGPWKRSFSRTLVAQRQINTALQHLADAKYGPEDRGVQAQVVQGLAALGFSQGGMLRLRCLVSLRRFADAAEAWTPACCCGSAYLRRCTSGSSCIDSFEALSILHQT